MIDEKSGLLSEYSLSSLPDVNASEAGTRRKRVRAMPPQDRRDALIAVTIPLLREFGAGVSTRQIADAAGVAEGTIFNVFPDKQTLIIASIRSAFDPEPLKRALAAIERIPGDTDAWRRADLRRRLVAAVEIVEARMADNASLLVVVHTAGPAGLSDIKNAREGMARAIAGVVGPDDDLLRLDPMTTAWLLMSMVLSSRQRPGPELDASTTVSVLLDGLLAPSATNVGDSSC